MLNKITESSRLGEYPKTMFYVGILIIFPELRSKPSLSDVTGMDLAERETLCSCYGNQIAPVWKSWKRFLRTETTF